MEGNRLTGGEDREPNRPMQAGESRTYTGEGKSAQKTVTIIRTDRPYAEDLCDAYNASMGEEARKRGLRWQVSHAGELKLGYSVEAAKRALKAEKDRRETERSRFIQRQFNPIVG
jgi:hypothetical protein